PVCAAADPLSLHDALPISARGSVVRGWDCKGLHAGKRGPCGRFFARGVGLMIGLFSLNSPFFRCGRLLPSTSFHVVTRTAVRGVTDVEPVIHDYVEREGIAGIRG